MHEALLLVTVTVTAAVRPLALSRCLGKASGTSNIKLTFGEKQKRGNEGPLGPQHLLAANAALAARVA